MCRNIKTLFNFEPPVTDQEVRAASLQFVRKISGFSAPSKSNEVGDAGPLERLADRQRPRVDLRHQADEVATDGKAKARAATRFGLERAPR